MSACSEFNPHTDDALLRARAMNIAISATERHANDAPMKTLYLIECAFRRRVGYNGARNFISIFM